MIVITGATGNIGGEIARLLVAGGHPVRLFVRDSSRAPQLSGAQVMTGDLTQPATMLAAFEPGDTLFMVSVHTHNEARTAIHRGVIDAARDSGVDRIVYLSFLAASDDATNYHARSHGATERMIVQSGILWTFLRPSLYMQVLASRFDGGRVLRAPAGDGHASWVSRSDVAVAAAVVLSTTGHDGRVYDITGPESLSMGETATVVSNVVGREFRYIEETSNVARRLLRQTRQDEWQVEARVASWESVRVGEVARVSDAVEHLTGRPPTSLRRYVEANINEFA